MEGKEYLAFTKKERKGIALLLVILVAVIFLPRIFGKNEHAKFAQYEAESASGNSGIEVPESTVHQNQEISTPRNSDKTPVNKNSPRYALFTPSAKHHVKARKKIEPFEINQADTSAFIALPMIGSKLAQRIVNFREKLGGFVRVQQVGEVYGVNDTVFTIIKPYLICDASLAKKIRINSADVKTLASHPYIRWQWANAIVNYRSQHAHFKSIRDLEQIHNTDSAALSRLEMYITFE